MPVDEEEIDDMIITSKEERDFKDRMWKRLNKDWIIKQNIRKRNQKAYAKQIQAKKKLGSNSDSMKFGQKESHTDISEKSGEVYKEQQIKIKPTRTPQR